MDDNTFTNIVDSLVVVKTADIGNDFMLTVLKPQLSHGISVPCKQSPTYIEKRTLLRDTFNSLIDSLASYYEYDERKAKSFYAATNGAAARHIVKYDPESKDYVYIRSKGDYNNNGSRQGTGTSRKGGHTNTMKNRKVTLTLFTLISGFALTLQITSASKDAVGWTRFCDPDNSKPEYDNITWTKDVYSTNKDAVEAIDAMIQIEEDYAAGKLSKEDAIEQFKDKYTDWVLAHLETNPEFVERRIAGLNCGEDLMAQYFEEGDTEGEPEQETESTESAE